MGYYMRFIVTDSKPLDFSKLEQDLHFQDANYALKITSERELDVLYAGEAHAELEINQPGDGLFEAEIGELMDFLEDVRGRARKRVLNTLGNATRIIAAQILYGGRELDLTLERLDPVWDWLFAQHAGLLQADDRGYYDADKLILEVD
jgi:hypothetical protein